MFISNVPFSFILLTAPAHWPMHNEFGKATESLQLFGKCWVVNNNECIYKKRAHGEREKIVSKMNEGIIILFILTVK